eukprot:TRINITY_DN15021_c0_g1_i1.p1 TRINITY_DN15021_c0_g1~~TRINITY_DN15021_c0_g1_i1.p1  ORF type:complete len:377 (+),score=55.75 TRINITY_DN15021_c0_g1_i1:107-1237(+)
MKKALIAVMLMYMLSLLSNLSILKEQQTRSSPRIDIVYSYVNGSTSTRQELKKIYLDLEKKKINGEALTNVGESLARDNNELFFSLRSIAQHLPWFNGRIFIVADEIPCWLNVSHPKIRLVSTKSIMSSKHLPSFNSHAIEANLHKIKGLSEYYLYFNDDYMLGDTIPQDYYFEDRNCMTFYHDERRTLRSTSDSRGWNIHRQAMKNTNKLLDQRFGFKLRYFLPHAPHLFKRSIMKQIHSEFTEAITNTSSNRFRSWNDIHTSYLFTNYVVEHPEYCSRYRETKNNCVRGVEYCKKLLFTLKDTKDFFAKINSEPPRKFYNVNDHVEDGSAELEEIMEMFSSFLWNKYPHRSPWERKGSNCVIQRQNQKKNIKKL